MIEEILIYLPKILKWNLIGTGVIWKLDSVCLSQACESQQQLDLSGLSLRPVWATKWIPGDPELYKRDPCLKQTQANKLQKTHGMARKVELQLDRALICWYRSGDFRLYLRNNLRFFVSCVKMWCLNSGVGWTVRSRSSETHRTVWALSPFAAGSEASGPQLLPVRALNEVFIGESLSSRYLEACDLECGVQCLSLSSGVFISFLQPGL